MTLKIVPGVPFIVAHMSSAADRSTALLLAQTACAHELQTIIAVHGNVKAIKAPFQSNS